MVFSSDKLLRAFAACLLLAAGCGGGGASGDAGPAAPDASRPRVCVSIPPQAWLVRELGCGRVDTDVLLPDGRDPHVFDPSARQAAAIAKSDAYLLAGLPFEAHVRKLAPARDPFFFPASPRPAPSASADHDDHDGHDGHDGHDPHIWLTPAGMERLAGETLVALDAVDPGGARERRAAFSSLQGRLARMDADFEALFAPHAGKLLLVHHPSWGHFARRYGLRMEAIESEGREPSARRLAGLAGEARALGVRTVFAEPQFSRRSAEAVAAQLDGKVVVVDPLPADWEAGLRAAAAAFAAALAEEKAPAAEIREAAP